MKRVLTAAVLIPVVLFVIFRGSPRILLGVIAVIAFLTFSEYAQLLAFDKHLRTLGLIAGIGLLYMPVGSVFLAMLLVTLLALALPMRYEDIGSAFARSAAMLLGIVYVFGAFKTAYFLGSLAPWWLAGALAINWVGDSGAYYLGRKFGRHKMAPRISPGKSWEGAAASLVFSIVFTMLLLPRVLPIAMVMAALVGFAGNLAGQLGDLAESALKRSVGAKDSGTLLPGHGGFLDRVDSALFTLPVVYALIVWLHL
jgi:phosphatidate cytidylyltransferase